MTTEKKNKFHLRRDENPFVDNSDQFPFRVKGRAEVSAYKPLAMQIVDASPPEALRGLIENNTPLMLSLLSRLSPEERARVDESVKAQLREEGKSEEEIAAVIASVP